jgi:uncharacterized protein YndB with AHSA1/START domain
VAPIVTSIEIARSPEDVFAYVTDPSRLTEWQESLVGSRTEGGGPAAVGLEGHTDPPRRSQRTHDDLGDHGDQSPEDLAVRGIDGPVRGMVRGTVEPVAESERSRVTIELDFETHGIGKLLVPLVVRRQTRSRCPPTCGG